MYKKKIIYCIIPARSGSKSIKNKNIILINNKPLISYSIKTSTISNLIDKTFVLTDSKKYAKIAIKYGAAIPYIRSKKISNDKSSDYDTIFDFLQKIKNRFVLPDFIVHLRPTSPIRETKVIEEAIKKFINLKRYTALRSIHKMSETAYKSVEIKNKQLVATFSHDKKLDKYNKPRQKFPLTFHPNGYVDILKTKFVIKKKLLHGEMVLPFITNDHCEIDSIENANYASYIIKKKK